MLLDSICNIESLSWLLKIKADRSISNHVILYKEFWWRFSKKICCIKHKPHRKNTKRIYKIKRDRVTCIYPWFDRGLGHFCTQASHPPATNLEILLNQLHGLPKVTKTVPYGPRLPVFHRHSTLAEEFTKQSLKFLKSVYMLGLVHKFIH